MDLALLIGNYLKAKLSESDLLSVRELSNIIYVDSDIGKAQKKILLITASGITDDVNPIIDIDLQVKSISQSVNESKRIANIINSYLDGLYYEQFEETIFSSNASNVAVSLGKKENGTYTILQHFRIVYGKEK
jgi:hypothetical protein